MSAASDAAPYVIIYMGPILGFLGLSSFLWINLTLNAVRRMAVRRMVGCFWGSVSACFVAAGLYLANAIPFGALPQVYAALGGAFIGASSVLAVQFTDPKTAL